MSRALEEIGCGFFDKIGLFWSFNYREIALFMGIAHTATYLATMIGRHGLRIS